MMDQNRKLDEVAKNVKELNGVIEKITKALEEINSTLIDIYEK